MSMEKKEISWWMLKSYISEEGEVTIGKEEEEDEKTCNIVPGSRRGQAPW